MTGTEFERFLGIIFRNLGYQVTKASRRQGADLAVEQFGERTLVQVKRYAGRVPESAVQEMVAAKGHYRCDRALVVASSTVTEGAKQLAAANGVALWDRDQLASVIAR